ncbi:MAG: RNA-binding protein [Candidatus Falkowbacteria bacterium]|nr:RNA-binding protein [Candidatus Falkowbacteria bacterium]
MKKLFIGNLPYQITEDELKDAFSAAGTVESVFIVKDRMTGRAKGFGFVEMSSDDEAGKAVSMFNNQEMGGRKIIVNEARPMEKRF